jgi:predicted nuclease of predicted toxin-antitoxin system
MTIWLDAHLDPELAPWLGVRFDVTAKPLREIGLRDADDIDLFEAARRFGNIVIMTKDSDFVALVQRLGKPPQVLWLTCGNLSTLELQSLLSREFATALQALEAGQMVVEISGT